MILLDAVLMAGIAAVIVGFLVWSIRTQYRDAGWGRAGPDWPGSELTPA